MPEMFYTQSDDVEGLIALVESKLSERYGQDPTIGAIRRLGDLGDKRAIPVLRRASEHANKHVSGYAAEALSKLGDSSTRPKEMPTGRENHPDAMLTLDNVSVNYGAIEALRGISMRVEKGEVVTLIGANGAGKTTTLRTITGLLSPREGTVTFEGEDISGKATHKLVARGISMSPEGRGVFANLTVRENLQMGAYLQKKSSEIAADMERCFKMFPRLKERENQKAGTLSGGEQQMLAMGRALMSRPRLLLLDEPSLGLAPLIVHTIFEAIDDIRSKGTTILLVEQNAHAALKHSDRCYVLETGGITMEGPSKDLANDPRIKEAYLGE
jgi:branched-chain amino acid transport system ATP-binding protein